GDPGHEAASSDWYEDPGQVRHVVQQLEADASVARHHLLFGKRVDEELRLGCRHSSLRRAPSTGTIGVRRTWGRARSAATRTLDRSITSDNRIDADLRVS